MSLLFPLGMAALGALAPLLVLYLLKQKRVDLPVPAAFLWRQALQDLRASSLFQRLRTPLLLILQAAAVLLFALAAAGASLDLDLGDEPRRIILLIDRSASMGATDESGGSSRLDVARELALDAVDGLSGADEMMLVAFDAEAHVLCAFTGDTERLETLLLALEARDLPTHPADAFRLAGSFGQAAAGFQTEIVLISDGAFDDELPPIGFPVTYARVGNSAANQGIAAAQLSHVPGEPPQLFVRVENGDSEPRERTVVLRRGGEIVDARHVATGPGGEAGAFFELTEPEGDTEVLLQVTLEGSDALATDDRVDLVLRPAVPRTGLLIAAQESLYLDPEKLESLHPGLAVARVTPAEAEASFDAGTTVDFVCYDGVAPERLPPVPAQLYLNALPPGSGLRSEGTQEYPIVIDWDRTHATTARCEFDDVVVATSMRLTGAERSHSLVDSTGGPLVLLSPVPGREVVVVAFSPADSNLPLKLAWPLFLANTLDHLIGGIEREGEEPVSPTGTAIRAASEGALTVTTASGERSVSEPSPRGVALFTGTGRAGLYTVQTASGDAAGRPPTLRSFALLNSAEIRTAPRETVLLGSDEVASDPSALRRNVLLRDPLLLLALGLLVFEWAVWCGRR